MKKIISILLVAVLAVLAFPVKTFAQDNVAKNFTLEKGSIVAHNPYFAYGNNVNISGTVNGDTYVAGGKVVIDGNINGDLLVAGGDVEISGSVKEDVRVMGGQVTISGKVGKNVSVAAGNIKVTETAVIAKSFVATGGNIEILGLVNDNVDIAGGNIKLGSKMAKDFDVAAGQITLSEKANILGKFEYWSDSKPVIAQTAVIKGQVIEHPMPVHINTDKNNLDKAKTIANKVGVGGRLIGTLSLLVIGMLLIKLSGKFMEKTGKIVKDSFWKSMGIGFLIVFLTPVLFIILLITIIGAPIALITITLYFIMLYMTKIFAIFALGTRILPKKSPYFSYSVALIIYAVVVAIPVIGGIVSFIVLLTGMGALAISKKESLIEYNK